jgi:hypothetical protein
MQLRLGNKIGCAVFLILIFGPGLVVARLRHSMVWAFIGPFALCTLGVLIAALPFKRRVTPHEFANELERHLMGEDDDDEWDRTSAVSISDLRLDQVRRSLSDRFDSLSTTHDRDQLRHVIEALRRGEFPGALPDDSA